MDFCMFYYTTALASTILTNYLSSTSLAFYGNFDAAETSAEPGSSDGNNLTTMSKMALDIMKQLVSFVTEATESYHKSDDFEVSRLAFLYIWRSKILRNSTDLLCRMDTFLLNQNENRLTLEKHTQRVTDQHSPTDHWQEVLHLKHYLYLLSPTKSCGEHFCHWRCCISWCLLI